MNRRICTDSSSKYRDASKFQRLIFVKLKLSPTPAESFGLDFVSRSGSRFFYGRSTDTIVIKWDGAKRVTDFFRQFYLTLSLARHTVLGFALLPDAAFVPLSFALLRPFCTDRIVRLCDSRRTVYLAARALLRGKRFSRRDTRARSSVF